MNKAVDDGINKFSNDDLKEMQGWDLSRKIQTSKAKIIEFAEKFDDKIYVLFVSNLSFSKSSLPHSGQYFIL